MSPLPRPAPGTLRWWVIGTLVIGAFVIGGSWFVVSREARAITAETVGYKVDSDASTTVTFTVTKPEDVHAVCTVQALDVRHAVVGTGEVDVPAGGPRTRTLTATAKTTSLAVTGVVSDCVHV